ncbi:MAG: zinc ribbon domain-containing protein [Promethearchaeota archaeon]
MHGSPRSVSKSNLDVQSNAEPEKKRSGGFDASGCEGIIYIGAGVIIGCVIIGFIVWQLILLGQVVGVIIGLITFISLLVTLILYFQISGKGENPSLALKLRIAATILFVVFLIEAIFTFRFFWTPIFYPIINQLLTPITMGAESGIVMILVIGFFLILIVLYFSIPICLWTRICKTSKDIPPVTPATTPTPQKDEGLSVPKECPACGKQLKGTEQFCANCGVAIDTS